MKCLKGQHKKHKIITIIYIDNIVFFCTVKKKLFIVYIINNMKLNTVMCFIKLILIFFFLFELNKKIMIVTSNVYKVSIRGVYSLWCNS